MIITLDGFVYAAQLLKIEVATVKAVAEVESGGCGFVNGLPVILFEPHVFWKELRKRKFDPEKYLKDYGDMLYPLWGAKPYPKGQDAQYKRLDRAANINRDAALCSCSWGKFQIMGYNWQLCGSKTLQEFINGMHHDEDEHLNLFVNYIRKTGLDDELRAKDWKGFARGYNGALYYRNNYDKKLLAAYNKFKSL
ncbi:MAG TPA: N-acetylmuramidase family protein [Chitinophagaceae bacterium]|nr:N-acetylmuramidase family protein [Chitinophagaceae bacterium]